MPIRMYRSILITCASIVLLLFMACDEISQDAESEPEVLKFTTEPSDDLSQLVQEASSDFSWKYFSENILLTEQSGNNWEDDLVLTGFQILNAEIVDRTGTDSFRANNQMLLDGILTGELQSVNFTITDWGEFSKRNSIGDFFELNWKNAKVQSSLELWETENYYSPSEIEDAILSESDLHEGDALYVVYLEMATVSPERKHTTKPFGLIVSQEQPSTGSLEIITETGGTNPDDSYEVLVDDQTETIGANETITISDLEGADYDVELRSIADNCTVVNGENPRTVTINADQTTSTTFEVNCAEAFSNGLAFTSFREGNANINTITEDGSKVSQLTTNSSFDAQAAISPSGTKIAFTSERDGNRNIYLMNLGETIDDTDIIHLTDHPERDEHPAWSPDGKQLAFSSQRDGVDDIFIMDSDGSNITKVTSNPEVDTHPSWSSDGNSITFQTLRDGDWTIYKINIDGSGATRLTPSDAQSDRDPEYSPDGSQIAYSSATESGEQIFVMDSDGTNHTQITTSDSRDILPTWSSNGNFIGFQSNRSGSASIYIIGSDGSSPNRLTESSAFDEFPDWSPVE